MKKKLIRLTESDLHNIIREGVRRVLKEANYRSGYVSNDGNGMVGGSWYSSEVDGNMYFPYDQFADWLLESDLIDKGVDGEGPEYEAVNKYFVDHEDDFIINATCDSGEDNSVNYSWCDITPDEECLKHAIETVNACTILSDEAKETMNKWLTEYFKEETSDYDNYTWEEPYEPDYESDER